MRQNGGREQLRWRLSTPSRSPGSSVPASARWWRRTALVATTGLNVKTRGDHGDARRTFAVCEMLTDDHDDMVVKAMSWALRELVPWEPNAVERFLSSNEDRLAARVKREVRNKLRTGLKNPRKTPS